MEQIAEGWTVSSDLARQDLPGVEVVAVETFSDPDTQHIAVAAAEDAVEVTFAAAAAVAYDSAGPASLAVSTSECIGIAALSDCKSAAADNNALAAPASEAAAELPGIWLPARVAARESAFLAGL